MARPTPRGAVAYLTWHVNNALAAADSEHNSKLPSAYFPIFLSKAYFIPLFLLFLPLWLAPPHPSLPMSSRKVKGAHRAASIHVARTTETTRGHAEVLHKKLGKTAMLREQVDATARRQEQLKRE
jgi:hypothetical protein